MVEYDDPYNLTFKLGCYNPGLLFYTFPNAREQAIPLVKDKPIGWRIIRLNFHSEQAWEDDQYSKEWPQGVICGDACKSAMEVQLKDIMNDQEMFDRKVLRLQIGEPSSSFARSISESVIDCVIELREAYKEWEAGNENLW